MNVILFQPQIPQNTGNIVRTCAVTGSTLTLIRPFGFSLASRHLKRAGLDYWNDVCIRECDDLMTYLEDLSSPFFFFSSKARFSYTEASYPTDGHLIFGSETAGLPDVFRKQWPERFYRIPMQASSRCLNLACCVAVVLYEALRQQNFSNLAKLPQCEGELLC